MVNPAASVAHFLTAAYSEMLFGNGKHNFALARLRRRGISGAKDEFLLTATVQNLKRLAKLNTISPPQPQTT